MDFDEFLKAVLPPLGYNWRKHRRKAVRRRVLSRVRALGLTGVDDYVFVLERDPAELAIFRGLLTVTISRFYRDPPVFERIRDALLPRIMESRKEASVWSAGSASGEEPYTLAMVSAEYFPASKIRITATDIDLECMERARSGIYGESSVKKLPVQIRSRYFKKAGGLYVLDEVIKKAVEFVRHDILHDEPLRDMDIVLCRNLAYTYFDKERQIIATQRLHSALRPSGYLVLGRTEDLPEGAEALFISLFPEEKIYLKI